MTKARITATITYEYELRPENYPEEINTPEAMIKYDAENNGTDILNEYGDLSNITWTIIKEDSNA